MGRKSRRKSQEDDQVEEAWSPIRSAKLCADLLGVAQSQLHPATVGTIVSGLRTEIDQLARLDAEDPDRQARRQALLPVGTGLEPAQWIELEEALEARIRRPVESPADYEQQLRDLARLAPHGRRYPAHTEAYVISPEMHNVVVAAALTLTAEDLFTLDPEFDPPTPAGMLLLPTQMWRSERYAALSAIGWQPYSGQVLPGGPVRAGVWVEGWSLREHLQYTPMWQFVVRTSRNVDRPPPQALPNTFVWLLGDRADQPERDVLRAVDRQAGELRHVSLGADKVGLDGKETETSAEYDPDRDVDFAVDKYLFAFWKLYSAGTSIAQRADGNPVRRRGGPAATGSALDERPIDRVRIVRLRGADSPTGEPGDRGTRPRYSHRWPVRIHKVNQSYPSTHTHKVRFRGPYIKGPDGAPLLIGPKAQGVV